VSTNRENASGQTSLDCESGRTLRRAQKTGTCRQQPCDLGVDRRIFEYG
jgi:hypothetical protein